MELISEALRDTVSEIAGELEAQIIQEEEGLVSLLNPDLLEQASWHFKFERFRQKASRYAELLKTDPSGFSVVDAAVEDVARLSTPSPFCVQEWVLAGAQIAQQIYKKIYPQAQALFRPSA